MPLVEVELPAPFTDGLPLSVRGLLRESGSRVEAFVERHRGALAGFVPADFERTYRALEGIAAADLAPGNAFCEWGSGLGIVALLAERLGFDAYGIEIEPELVDEARSLAADLGIDAEFACGTFVPPGGEDLTDTPQEFAWLAAGGRCGYEELDLEPEDFDLFFAYPWPNEEHAIEGLFERFAADAALLLTFHGSDDLRLQRKVAAPRRSRR